MVVVEPDVLEPGCLEERPRRGARVVAGVAGVELVEDRETKEPATRKTAALMEATKERGVLIGKAGNYGNVLRFAPPMLISETDLDEALRLIDDALAEVSGVERPALVQLG